MISVLKVLSFALLFYQLLYIEAFGQIPFFLVAGYLLLDVSFFVCLFCKKRMKTPLPVYNKALIIFFAYSLLSGLFVSVDLMHFLNKVFIGIEYLVLFLSIFYICVLEKKCDFIFKSLFLISLSFLIICLIRNNYVYNRLVISPTSNANVTGNICFLLSISCIYLVCSKKKYLPICLPSLGLSVYCVVLSGARKDLLVIALFLVLFLVFNFRIYIRKHLKSFVLFSIVSFAALIYFWPTLESFFTSSNIFERMNNSSNLDVGRLDLYVEAAEVFKSHPFFGVGYYGFELYNTSGLYAHSAYAEVLSCTGIVGFVLWLSFYAFLLILAVLLFIHKHRTSTSICISIMLICQIVLDFFSISLYMPGNFALLGAVAAYITIDRKRDTYENSLLFFKQSICNV